MKKTLGTVGYLYKFKRKFNNDIFLTNCDILLKANYKGILIIIKNPIIF